MIDESLLRGPYPLIPYSNVLNVTSRPPQQIVPFSSEFRLIATLIGEAMR